MTYAKGAPKAPSTLVHVDPYSVALWVVFS
jgi:hypothetical protein